MVFRGLDPLKMLLKGSNRSRVREGIDPIRVQFRFVKAKLSLRQIPDCYTLPGTTETNVAARARRRIAQVQSEDAGVGSAAPIAAA